MAMIFNHDDQRKGYNTGDFVPNIVFNAIGDYKNIGDEKYNFVTVKKQGEQEYKKVIKADLDEYFTVRIFFHNNADPSLSEEGVSYDTKIDFTSGSFLSNEDEWKSYGTNCQGFMGYVSSSNSVPQTVRDFCVVELPDSGTWKYIEGSARITTKSGTQAFPDNGGLIGIDQMDGIIPPGETGYVEMDYFVRKPG